MVSGYCRHPNTPVLQFKEFMMDILSTLRRNKKCIIAGDINIDFNEYGNVASTTDYVDE